MKIYAKIVGYGMTWFILFVLVLNAIFDNSIPSGAAKTIASLILLTPIGVYGYLTALKLKDLWKQFNESQK